MFGHRFAAQAPHDCADRCADDGAHRACSECSGRSAPGDTARRGSNTYTDRVCTRRARKRVAIRRRLVCSVSIHVCLRL